MFKLIDYTHTTDFSKIPLTPKEAILAKCYDCCAYDGVEVKYCNCIHCPLHQYKEKWFKIPRRRNPNDNRRFNKIYK